ncbi:signal peptidase I [Natronorubrum bangense]|uniref:Signal peptidase I n=2 Tax=Natronorubrum bangense TaxID=61858 RepID=L9W5V0_9EURY|nr:signal peptidase I [Natronorubrum bangense]ELY44845.1 signal peptidase I [Natronorubrum bangense JCM 10635]QCC56887.1 signal peptidase I [Natronorubrum bangense]
MNMHSSVKTGLTVLFGGGLLILLLLVGSIAMPGLVGGDDTYIVTSGSMSPTIEPGDVIVTQDVSPDEIETGDVITFHDGSSADSGYVTHRVADIVEEDGERYFELQGDANDNPDEGLVPAEYAQGDLHWHIPYLGHLLLFARSSLGLLVLVIGPGLALVASGSWQLLRELGVVGTDPMPELEAAEEPPALEPADNGALEDKPNEQTTDPNADAANGQPSSTDTADTETENDQ